MTTMYRTNLLDGSAADLQLCRAEVGAGYLWVQYRVAPVPEAARLRPRVRDLPCGAASVDGTPLPHCRASYRVGLDGVHIDGILALGPLPTQEVCNVQARFAPLPGVPGYEVWLFDVAAELAGGVVARAGAAAA